MTLRIFLFGFCLAAASALHAQEDLTRDRAFFEQQAGNYQRWLAETGLAPRLSVRSIEVSAQHLSLYLQFPAENTDTVKAMWRQLQADYATRQTGLRLEDALFFKMLHLMDLPPAAADLQLYDTYEPRREPGFFRAVYTDENGIGIDSAGDMSAARSVSISPGDLSGMPQPSVFECGRRFPRDIVLQQSCDFLRHYFLGLRCDSLPPDISEPQKAGDCWRFEVTNLCGESLWQAPESVVRPFLAQNGKPADWIRYEKLSFTLVYQGGASGCRVKCLLEVKAGNSPYEREGRGDYLDLGGAFLPFIKSYSDGLMEKTRVLVCGR